MTHGGQINISGLGQMDAFEVLRRNPNVCMETSGVYRQDFILDVVNQLGAQRVLFGSNSPRMDMRLEVERVRRADVSETARELMLEGNADASSGWIPARLGREGPIRRKRRHPPAVHAYGRQLNH